MSGSLSQQFVNGKYEPVIMVLGKQMNRMWILLAELKMADVLEMNSEQVGDEKRSH